MSEALTEALTEATALRLIEALDRLGDRVRTVVGMEPAYQRHHATRPYVRLQTTCGSCGCMNCKADRGE